MDTIRKIPAAFKTVVSKVPQTFGFRGHETNITSKSAYDSRIVGYLKATVNTAGRTRPLIRNVPESSKICYFEIRCDGKLAKRLDTIVGNDDKNLRLPESYVMDANDITDDAKIKTFSEQFGFTIDKPTTETTLAAIQNGANAYTTNTHSICIDGALDTATTAAAALADDDKPIFKLLPNPEEIAFFIVDLAREKIYTCRLSGTNYKVNWEGDVTDDGVRKGISIPTGTDWSNVWSYIPFFTVPDLSKLVQDSDINFYPRTNLRFTGDAAAAATDYKKIPPPFYLAFTIASKTMAAVLRVQGTIANVNYQAEQTAARTDIDDKQAEKVSVKEEVVFINRLNKFGCQQDDNNLLGVDECTKVATIKNTLNEQAKKLFSGGRSKRNKHRRNKRTVSHRGRGHKRSRRVDGGSRKCGKKCRRKHTRK